MQLEPTTPALLLALAGALLAAAAGLLGLTLRMRGDLRRAAADHALVSDELRRSEQLYRAVVEDQSEFICRFLPDGTLTFVNEAYCRHHGRPREQLLGTSFLDYLPAEDRPFVRDFLASFAPAAPSSYLEQRVVIGEATFWHAWRDRAFFDAQGRLLEFQAVGSDISDRRAADEALRRAEQRYRTLFDEAPVMYVIADGAGRVIDCNQRLLATLGFARGEVLGRPLASLAAPPAPADDHTASSADRLLCRDGSVVYVLSQASDLAAPAGGRQVAYVDISRLKQAENELRRARDELESRVGARTRALHEANQLLEQELRVRRQVEAQLRASEERAHDLFYAAQRHARELALLDEVRTALAREIDLATMVTVVVESIARTLGYQRVGLYLLEEQTLVLQHQVGHATVIERIPLSQGVVGAVARSGQPLLIEDVRQEPRFLGSGEDVASEICVPILDQGRTIGVLNIETLAGERLGPDDLRLVAALTDHVSLAFGQARLYAAVRESEERLSRLAAAAFEGIMIHEHGRILDVNHAFLDMFGFGEVDLRGQDIWAFIPPESRNMVAERISLQSEQSYEVIAYRQDGSAFPVEVVARQMPMHGRRVRVVALRDMTERKRAEAERERLIAELQEALANIKTLRGLLPICASCKRIRDDGGYWDQIETYLRRHSEASFTHGLCPECTIELYPDEEMVAATDEQPGERFMLLLSELSQQNDLLGAALWSWLRLHSSPATDLARRLGVSLAALATLARVRRPRAGKYYDADLEVIAASYGIDPAALLEILGSQS